jgi:large subunit ribosomal protein L29
MVKYQDLINQTREDLLAQKEEISSEIFSLSSELRVTRKLEKPHLLKEKKKDRARVLTALTQKREKN